MNFLIIPEMPKRETLIQTGFNGLCVKNLLSTIEYFPDPIESSPMADWMKKWDRKPSQVEGVTQRGLNELCVKNTLVHIWSVSRSHRSKPDGQLNGKMGLMNLPSIPESPEREQATQRGVYELWINHPDVLNSIFSISHSNKSDGQLSRW